MHRRLRWRTDWEGLRLRPAAATLLALVVQIESVCVPLNVVGSLADPVVLCAGECFDIVWPASASGLVCQGSTHLGLDRGSGTLDDISAATSTHHSPIPPPHITTRTMLAIHMPYNRSPFAPRDAAYEMPDTLDFRQFTFLLGVAG